MTALEIYTNNDIYVYMYLISYIVNVIIYVLHLPLCGVYLFSHFLSSSVLKANRGEVCIKIKLIFDQASFHVYPVYHRIYFPWWIVHSVIYASLKNNLHLLEIMYDFVTLSM